MSSLSDSPESRTATDPAAAGTAPDPAADPAGLSLREASEGDLDSIWRIESAVFGSDAWSREMMREELVADHRRYLVLVDTDGAVQGYAGLLIVGSEGDVQTIAVADGVRGGGHGRRLMDALLAEAERAEVREVFLEVRADNPVARGLYRSLGFEELGVRPRYYQPDGVDAVIMKLEMKGRR
ncbi:ribosomal protein S18-alanine N-acetyltransferase [Leucobacter chironomi]|uniref:ribosomal protein S18-alanine N-acetyltransferase n=1 Tax=Leucobacter chironomi TaxID=491918 RepID=UPI000410D5DA